MKQLRKIKLLDLCCKAGGCSVGYQQAAHDLGLEIEITGVDIEPQPNYPFTFIQADAVQYLTNHHQHFTHIHASPPCQEYSVATTMHKKRGVVYKNNLEELRTLMYNIDRPGVIENVMPSPVRPDMVLRGDMFGLLVLRSRKFELVNWFAMAPVLPRKKGSVREGDFISVFGKGSYKKSSKDKDPKFKKQSVKETWKHAMGIDWMTKEAELAEAIPPAYTRYIGFNFFQP